MKKSLCLLLIMLLLLPLTMSCQEENTEKVKVYVTNYPPYDFVKQIAKGKVEVTMLLSPGCESHYYEATLSELMNIQAADLFIYVGGESDTWVNDSLEILDSGNLTRLTLMDKVNTVNEETVEGMEHKHDDHHEEAEQRDEDHHDHEEAEPDEHIWTSPKNAKKIVQAICDSLCAIDEENATYYQENTAAYLKELDKLDDQFQSVVDGGKRKTIVLAERFPFIYLAKDYGLTYYAAFAGCSTQNDPSLATINFLIEKIESKHIPIVFFIEFSSEKTADTLCQSTGAQKRLPHSCHNVSKADFDKGVTYLELMYQNADYLAEALN